MSNRIKHVILENGDLMTGLPAGLTADQLRNAVAGFAVIKSGFNLYRSRGYKFCLGRGAHADLNAAGRARNSKSTGSFELTFNPNTKEVTAGATRLAYSTTRDNSRFYSLSVNGRELALEPFCSLLEAREDARDNGGIAIELRVSESGQLVSVKAPA